MSSSGEYPAGSPTMAELGASLPPTYTLNPTSKIPTLSTMVGLQVSASKIHRQSPAVSGSSSHQGAAKGMPASLSEVSPALSGDSAERKWKNRKIDKSVPEPPEVDAVKKTNELRVRKNEMSAVPREKPSAHFKQVVFAIPAPSMVNPSQRPPVLKGKPPTSSTSQAKAIKPEGKGESMAKATHPEVKGESRRLSSSSIPPVDSKQKNGTQEGAVSDVKKRKHENIPGIAGPRKKIREPTDRSNASVEREKPSQLQKRADGGIARGSSPAAEQKPRGQIFKPKPVWNVANLVLAIQNNRVLLLENLAAGLHSDDLAEALSEFFKHRCDVRIAPPESSSFRTTSALLKFPTASIAFKINESMNQKDVILSGRLVTASLFKYKDFKPKSSAPLGHIEDYRDAVATSHLAQRNTIQFDYGLAWRVLDVQHEEQWRMLQEAKTSRPEVKSESRRVASSSIAPVDSKQKVGTKAGAVSDVKKRKHENIPGIAGTRKEILKPTERSIASVEREKPSRLQKRADEGFSRGSSPAAEQKPRGQIFKPKPVWNVANLVLAIQNNRVLLLENLAAGFHSDDLAEALSEFFKHRCDVRIAPPASPSFRTTSALLKFPTASIAFKINESMNQKDVILSGRLVTTSLLKYQDFKPKSSTPLGHIELPKEGRDYTNADYRDAVATSHLAQGNTIEFDYGLEWRVLDEQHEEQWHMLQSCHKRNMVQRRFLIGPDAAELDGIGRR